tara:strand:+ start:500 stop:724 length:225 start_codon:yes stop_codon:yes gene_type:complete
MNINKRKESMTEDKKINQEEQSLGMNPMKDVKEDILLQGMIDIPVNQPTLLNQCGTWSIVYPSEYTRKERLSCS